MLVIFGGVLGFSASGKISISAQTQTSTATSPENYEQSSVKIIPGKDGSTVSLQITKLIPYDEFKPKQPPGKLPIVADASFANIGGRKPTVLVVDDIASQGYYITYTGTINDIDKTDSGLNSALVLAYEVNGKRNTERFDLSKPWTYGEGLQGTVLSRDEVANKNIDIDRCMQSVNFKPDPGRFDVPGQIMKGLCTVIILISETFEKAMSWAGDKLINFISEVSDYQNKTWTREIWGNVRTLVDIVAIIALIIIGFANILHINLNTYAVKRTLPMLIAGLIFANLSFYLSEIAITFGSDLTHGLADPAKEGMKNLSDALSKFAVLGLLAFFNPGIGCIVGLIVLIGIIALTILAFLAFAQPIVISVLVILAPLAFIAMSLPMTKPYFDKWLAIFINWVMMIPASLLIFALIKFVGEAGISNEETNKALEEAINNTQSTNFISALISFGVRIGLVILAIRIPFKMGGDIAAAWGKAGKWAAGYAGDKTLTSSLTTQGAASKLRTELKEGRIKKEQLTGRQKWLLGYSATRIPKLIANLHPGAMVMGFRNKSAQEKAAVEGLAPFFSETYSEIAGRGDVFAKDIEGQLKKREDPQNWPTAKLFTDLVERLKTHPVYKEVIEGRRDLSDTDLVAILIESMGSFRGNLDGGVYLAGVGKGDIGPVYADITRLIQRASRMAGIELSDSQANEFVKKLGLKTVARLPDRNIAAMSLEAQITDDELDQVLDYKGYNERQKARFNGVRNRLNRQRERGVYIDTSAGEEQDQDYFEDADVPIAQASQKQLEDSISDENANKPNSSVQAVEIVSAPELQVVDQALQMMIYRLEGSLKEKMKDEGIDDKTQASLLQAFQGAQISPADLQYIIEKGRPADLPETIKLPRETDYAMRRFALAVTRGQLITRASAENYFQRNLEDSLPYIGNVANLANQGKLRGQDIPALQQRIETDLSRLKNDKLSPAEFEALRGELARISPSANLRSEAHPAPEDLLRVGNQVSLALSQMNKPQVIRALGVGAQPSQVQEIVIKQAATDLLKETRAGEVQKLIKHLPAAPAPQKPAIEQAVRVQVAGIAREAMPESGFVKLAGAEQKAAVTAAATQAIGQGSGITVEGLTGLVDKAIKSVAGRGGGPSVAPPPTPPAASPR